MDNIRFYNSFAFVRFALRRERDNDSRGGITSHYVGRMRAGTGRIVTEEGEEMTLRAGDVFYLPRGLRYRSFWTPDRGGEVSWDSYRFDFFPCKSGREYLPQMLFPSARALAYLDGIDMERGVSVSAVGLLYAFMGEVFPTMKRSDLDAAHALLSRARHYMYGRTNFRVSALAEHLGMSESSLYALFRTHLGRTPTEEKNRILTERAVEHLRASDFSLEEIAGRLGLSSAAYLRRLVKQRTGKTPGQVRAEREGEIIL